MPSSATGGLDLVVHLVKTVQPDLCIFTGDIIGKSRVEKGFNFLRQTETTKSSLRQEAEQLPQNKTFMKNQTNLRLITLITLLSLIGHIIPTILTK